MRNLTFVSLISCFLTAISFDRCFSATLMQPPIAVSETLRQMNMFLINPIAAFFIMCAGMGLVIYQASDKKPNGVIGAVGLMLTGITYASWVIAGASGWTGILISAAGITLMYVESRVIPGHGIFAVIGTASIFAGTYLVFSNAQNGIFFPVLMAIAVSGSSAIAFIIHLPNNTAWKEIQKQIQLDESLQANTIQIDTSKVKAALRQKSAVRKQQSSQVEEQTGTIERIPVKDTKAPVTNIPPASETIESLRIRLAEIETYAIPIVAKQRRLEHQLNKANETLAKLGIEAQKAVENNDDNLASEILLGIETCRIRVTDLEEQLAAAKLHADAALQHIDEFRDALAESSAKALNIESRECLLLMQAQFRQMTSEDMKVIDEFEERADGACAEADVLEAMSAEDGNHQRMKKQFAERKTRADKALNDLKTQIRGSGASDPVSEQNSQQQTLGHD